MDDQEPLGALDVEVERFLIAHRDGNLAPLDEWVARLQRALNAERAGAENRSLLTTGEFERVMGPMVAAMEQVRDSSAAAAKAIQRLAEAAGRRPL